MSSISTSLSVKMPIIVLVILLICSYSSKLDILYIYSIDAIVENFYCTDACIGMSVYCYCDTTTPHLDWNITFPNGSEIVFEQFNMISSNHRDTKGFHFVYNNTNSNLTFVLNTSLNIIIECRNGGEHVSNRSIRSIAISDRGIMINDSCLHKLYRTTFTTKQYFWILSQQ